MVQIKRETLCFWTNLVYFLSNKYWILFFFGIENFELFSFKTTSLRNPLSVRVYVRLIRNSATLIVSMKLRTRKIVLQKRGTHAGVHNVSHCFWKRFTKIPLTGTSLRFDHCSAYNYNGSFSLGEVARGRATNESENVGRPGMDPRRNHRNKGLLTFQILRLVIVYNQVYSDSIIGVLSHFE